MSGAQQQQQVAQPAQGMRRIPIPLESYEKPEKIISAKRLLNFYAEQEQADARSAAALIPTPGLVPTGNVLGAGPVLALNSDMPGAIYGIAGTHAYRVTSAGVTDLGAVGTAAGSDCDRRMQNRSQASLFTAENDAARRSEVRACYRYAKRGQIRAANPVRIGVPR